ncbi:MAG: hypothetical protein IIT56_01760 [Bacteroidales bacterium]|nr:hypothetical protein [Bacteroidales bacterium]
MAESKHTTTEELNGLQTNYPKVPTVKDFLRVIKNPEVRAMLLSPPKSSQDLAKELEAKHS